jgi:putative heme-binding domain-containing protein
VTKVALDGKADMKQRRAALETLLESRAPGLRDICEKLIHVQFLNPLAATGLASFDDPAVGDLLVKSYREFHLTQRPQLLATLASRPTYAHSLLSAMAAGKIPRSDLTPSLARQIHNFDDPELKKQLTETWGELHDSPADKQQTIAALRAQLTSEALAKADKSAGRAVFTQTCAVCHRLYGEGADIGPDLTGSGRSNLDYLLENIVDPSAVIAADYRVNVVSLTDGRIFTGFVTAKTERTLSLKTPTEKLTFARSDIRSLEESPLSLMPEGLLQALPPESVRNLIAYLMSPVQAPLPAISATSGG